MNENEEKELIIGIDLGKTYSYIGIMRNGQIQIIQDQTGTHIIPSIICFKKRTFDWNYYTK